MPQAREILRRISSVKNTQQITRAMKMVAAAKLRRAQDRMMAMRPYADSLNKMLRYLAVDLVGDEHPLFFKREPKKVLTIVIAGDRGLCGGFNTNIIREANRHLNGNRDIEHELITIGKRATIGMRKTGLKTLKSYSDVFDKLSYVLSGEICDLLVEKYIIGGADQIDEAYIVYNEFVNSIVQRTVVRKIMPVDYKELAQERRKELEETSKEDEYRPIYQIEPDPETALKRLVSHRLATQVYQAVLESYAAELAARMSAMDSATNNADEMIGKLTLDYNRARQAGITGELLDIVGGANALSG